MRKPNPDRVNNIINAIADEDNFFSMNDFSMEFCERGQYCQTAACICGYANALAAAEKKDRSRIVYSNFDKAADYMYNDIDTMADQKIGGLMEELFVPIKTDMPLHSITRKQAIKVLEHFRDTGEVDWSKRND